jgi:hypothetical protein
MKKEWLKIGEMGDTKISFFFELIHSVIQIITLDDVCR